MNKSQKIFFVILSVATVLQGFPLDEDDLEIEDSPNDGTLPGIPSAPVRRFHNDEIAGQSHPKRIHLS